jgi:hypothetical protein
VVSARSLVLSALLIAWRLQKESRPASAATPTGSAGPNGFHSVNSEQHSGRTVGLFDLADQQCDRRIDRRHRRSAAEWIADGVPGEFHDLSSDAKGSGGSQEATARLTVTQAPPPPPPAPTVTDEDLFSQNIKDVYFDYDKSDIRGDQQSSVQADVAFLNQHANVSFTIEGHCDERGSTEYNLAWATSAPPR